MLRAHSLHPERTVHSLKRHDGLYFAVRELDVKIIRPMSLSYSEQVWRFKLRTLIKKHDLKPELATKDEITLLKGKNILGKSAPSGSLLSFASAIKLLILCGKDEYAEALQNNHQIAVIVQPKPKPKRKRPENEMNETAKEKVILCNDSRKRKHASLICKDPSARSKVLTLKFIHF